MSTQEKTQADFEKFYRQKEPELISQGEKGRVVVFYQQPDGLIALTGIEEPTSRDAYNQFVTKTMRDHDAGDRRIRIPYFIKKVGRKDDAFWASGFHVFDKR